MPYRFFSISAAFSPEADTTTHSAAFCTVRSSSKSQPSQRHARRFGNILLFSLAVFLSPSSIGSKPSTTVPLLSVFSPQKRSSSAQRAAEAPSVYVRMPLHSKPKEGIPERASVSAAMPSKSVPTIIGTELPTYAMKFGCSCSAARSALSISTSSLPMTASISVSPLQYTMPAFSCQRGSSNDT